MLSDRKNTLYNTYGTFLYFFCQWLTTIAVVKLADFTTAGIYSLIISITNVFYCISLYGLRNYQVSDISGEFSEYDYILVKIFTTLISFVLFFIAVFFLNINNIAIIGSFVYIFYKYGESASDLIFGFMQKYDIYKSIAVSYTLKGILVLFSFCIFLYYTKNLILTLFVNVMLYLSVIIFYDLRKLKRNYSIVFSLKEKKYYSLLYKCFPLMIYTLLVPSLNFITRYAVEINFGTNVLGFYSTVTMIFAVLNTLTNSVFVTILPKISLLYKSDDLKKIKQIIFKVFMILLVLFFISAFFASLFGDFIFCKIFGNAILDYMYLLQPTILGAVSLSFFSFLSSILISMRQIKVVLISSVFGILACAVLVIFLLQCFGLIGVMLSMIISILIMIFVSLYFIFRNLKTDIGGMLKCLF